MARFVCTFLTALLLAPACGYDDAGTFLQDESAGDSSAGQIEDEAIPTALLDCELEVPCEFPFAGLGFETDAKATAFSPSDRCIFTTLAGGEPALVETIAEFSDATAHLDYVIVGAGVALRQASGESEAGGRWQKGVFTCQLQPSAFFTECLKTASAACLDPEQWVVACEPLDNLVCPG